jgi:uncharacterized protein (DUF697 family)
MKLLPIKLLRDGTLDLKEYQDTLKRLLTGGFADIPPEERKEKTDQIIRASAAAAMAMGATPVPFLEMPVIAAMVRAIGKVYGVDTISKKVMLEIAAAMGGGLLVRQAFRLIPFVGAMAGVSRVYATTWAVGRAAQYYFSGGQDAPGQNIRQVFEQTMEAKQREQGAEGESLEDRLRKLDDIYQKNLISEQDYLNKKKELLDSL